MVKMKHFHWLLMLPLLMGGCASFSITNLTPSSVPRNADGSYPVEMLIDSRQQTLRHDSVKPYVVVGFDFYPMQRTLKMQNRWETLVPIPAEQDVLHYRFKVDYDYNDFGDVGQGSKMSTEYILKVRD